MAVKTQCPRCKQPLSVPSKLAGSYANCPRCQGRFWISKDSPLDSSISDSVNLSGSTLTLTQAPAAQSARPASGYPAVPPSATASAPAPPRAYFPSVTPLAPVAKPQEPAAAAASPTPPPQARKVARLVSAEAAESNLKIAPDGQLPNLQLLDVENKDKAQGKSRSVPPLVLVAVWLFSVVMTVAIFLFSGNNSDSAALMQKKAQAMKEIEDQYFGDPSHVALLPYQRLLRDAQQARARDDFKAEKQYYRQVLDQLRTESHAGGQSSAKHLEKGVTGSREHDRELEKLIITVLGD
jgi:hypothetical protein